MLHPNRVEYLVCTYPCDMYSVSSLSKSAVLETYARNGLDDISCVYSEVAETYYRPTSAELVEIEDALKAGQVVESARDTQFWATMAGVRAARRPKAIALHMAEAQLIDIPGIV